MEIKLKWVAQNAILYAVLAFLWSSVGFLTSQTVPYAAEYTGQFLVIEVGGHVLFGLVVGAMTRDVSIGLLVGAESALIDADHLMSIYVAPILDRTAHSFCFIAIACLLLGYLTKRGRALNYPVIGATVSAFFAHLSYDTFLSNGRFPLLAPFDFSVYMFPDDSWILLELAAIAVGLAVGLMLRNEAAHISTVEGISKQDGDRDEENSIVMLRRLLFRAQSNGAKS